MQRGPVAVRPAPQGRPHSSARRTETVSEESTLYEQYIEVSVWQRTSLSGLLSKSSLTAAKATPGSALEKLIKDNQDVHLLEPDEAHDNVGLPLWLRVHWRKAHPDVPHPKVNAGAGYPDVLHTIYTWMLANPDLPGG